MNNSDDKSTLDNISPSSISFLENSVAYQYVHCFDDT